MATFGLVAGIVTWVAMRLVAPVARRLGGRIEVVAGLVLIAPGVRILQDHIALLPLG